MVSFRDQYLCDINKLVILFFYLTLRGKGFEILHQITMKRYRNMNKYFHPVLIVKILNGSNNTDFFVRFY